MQAAPGYTLYYTPVLYYYALCAMGGREGEGGGGREGEGGREGGREREGEGGRGRERGREGERERERELL